MLWSNITNTVLRQFYKRIHKCDEQSGKKWIICNFSNSSSW